MRPFFSEPGGGQDPEALSEYSLKLERDQASGAKYTIHPVSGREDFGGEAGQVGLTGAALERIRSHLSVAASTEVISIGQGPTWEFPDSAGAPKRQNRKETFMGAKLFIPNCVPEMDSAEYAYWAGTRDGMWMDLVKAFPELGLWMVGSWVYGWSEVIRPWGTATAQAGR